MPQFRLIRVALLIALAAPLTQQLLGDQARDARWKQDVATFSNQLPAPQRTCFSCCRARISTRQSPI
jgi:hypothetical protein